jgi:hypothetical protein
VIYSVVILIAHLLVIIKRNMFLLRDLTVFHMESFIFSSESWFRLKLLTHLFFVFQVIWFSVFSRIGKQYRTAR